MESGCYLNKRLAFVELNKAHTSLDMAVFSRAIFQVA